MRKLLDHLEPGVLKEHVSPIQKRLDKMLEYVGHGSESEMGRIRILSMLPRSRALPHFARVSTAVLARKRLLFSYAGRAKQARSLSPAFNTLSRFGNMDNLHIFPVG